MSIIGERIGSAMKERTVLVTGGAGFIGSHLCEGLLQRGHRVVCFDNLSTGLRQNIAALEPKKNFHFIQGDVNTPDLDAVFREYPIEWVFHHAAVVGVWQTLEQPLLVLNDIKGIHNILELGRKHNVQKLVFASSSEVYGEPLELPEREDGPWNAKLPYAITKLVGESYFQSYYKAYGIPTCSLRLFNVYGPRQRSDAYGFVVGIFIQQCLQNKQPTIFGNGKQTRDFVFIKDNVEATIRAMEKNETNGKVINVGTGRKMTILELARMVIRLTGEKIKPRFLPKREHDVLRRYPSVEKMKELLQFECRYTLQRGLQETIRWYQHEKG
ncbi:SDR family NAD(P)-dependent oxidoreductase [Candidatus Woesearchaeota archaeon]|nr:SDR family NAD(P)-dependent oxidoreductase [Candidatus Woesearchaeota archaeon]